MPIFANFSLVLGLTATTPIEYPTITDFAESNCPAELSCSLNISNGIFGVGDVSGNYSTPGNANYTATSSIFTVTINQNSSLVLGIAGTTPITYGTITDVAGSGCPGELSCSLNISNAIYSAGVTNFNYSTPGNTNYTSTSSIFAVTINKATTTTLSLIGTTPINYGTTTDFIGSGCPGYLACSLNISNGIFGVGTISANYSTPGNENYTSDSDTFTITINQANPTLSLTGTTPITYGTTTDFNGGSCPSQLVCNLNITNGIFGAGAISANYSTIGNTNYTTDSEIFTITINKATGSVFAYINNSRSNFNGINGTTGQNIWLNGSLITGLINTKSYLNGTLINNGSILSSNLTNLSLGSYYFNVTYDGDENYTSDEEHWLITISLTSLAVTNSSITSICDESDLTFLEASALAGILLTIILVVGVIGFLVLSFKGVIEIDNLNGISLEEVIWGTLIIGFVFFVLATMAFLIGGNYCPAIT